MRSTPIFTILQVFLKDTVSKAQSHLQQQFPWGREGLIKVVVAFGVNIQVLIWYYSGSLAKHLSETHFGKKHLIALVQTPHEPPESGGREETVK